MQLYSSHGHTKTDLKVHLIWVPKYRRRALVGEVGETVRALIRRICSELEVHIISGKVAVDHVHLFVSYPPKLSVSDMAHRLKGKSAHLLYDALPHLKKKFWGGHFWARGYCAISSGNITDELIQAYIENQEGEDIHGPVELG